MIWLAALIAPLTGHPATPEPPPTFEQAMKLPLETLARQALGTSGVLFREVQRPYQFGLPPVTSYDLTFAAAPEETRYNGLCRADTVTIVYWSRDELHENIWDQPVVAKYWRQATLFRYLPLDAPKADCAHSGPVLRDRNRDWDGQNLGFGYGQAFGRELTELDAYFAGRALVKAMAYCGHGSCAVPAMATAAFPIARLTGFAVDYCKKQPTRICVTAHFTQPSPKERPGPIYGLEAEIMTDSSRITDGDFNVTAVTHQPTEAYVH